MAEAAPLIQLDGVAARAGAAMILRDLSFQVAPGEAVALYGANGAGKTTVLRVVATLHPITTGTLEVLGVDTRAPQRYDIRPRLGLLGHVPALYPEMSLRDNLRYVAEVGGHDLAEVDAALVTVGLAAAADRPATAASFGMQRRCEIARELLRRPDVLLLDEPHSALDESAVELVVHLVNGVTARGGCVLIASHDRSQVDKLTGRQLLLEAGSVR